MINVDAEAFRRSLGILGELEAWKNKIIIVQYIFVKLKKHGRLYLKVVQMNFHISMQRL